MRAVVVGGSGQIGGHLLDALAERGHEGVGTFQTVPTPGLVPLDAAELDASAAWLRGLRPDVVFYPAGFTWVDGCERDPARSRSANRDQPINLARAAASVGARFVLFSTDYVFDGQAGPYDEASPTNPLSEYGRSKLGAELDLAALGPEHLTLRTSWVFGPERQGKNFAYQLVKALRDGRSVECPSDQASSPSYGPDIALAAVALAESGASGLVHLAGPEVTARPDFARAIARAFRLDPSLISSRPTAEIAQGAPRPLACGLTSHRLVDLLPAELHPRPLAPALDDFLERLDDFVGWADPRAI